MQPERLDVLTFLARVLDHVPEPRQQQVRYWGWYSNAARGKRRKIEPSPPSACGERKPTARQWRRPWARLIKKVYEPANARLVSPSTLVGSDEACFVAPTRSIRYCVRTVAPR